MLLALLLAGAGAQALEIRSYEARIDVGRDGSARTTATVALAGAAPGRHRIPVGASKVLDFRPGEAPAGVALAPRMTDSSAWVDLDLPEGVPTELKLGFSYRSNGVLFVPKPEPGQKPTLPAGSELLRHRFTNTQEAPVGRYAATVLFPEGVIAHKINEQLPKTGRKEFVPRVELGRFEGRQGAVLQAANLRQGDRTSMELEIVAQQRSFVWLVLLLPLAVGYLFAFRDLVRAEPAGA